MSVFDNFDKIANRYREVYGKEKSQKRRNNKFYLKDNPDSDKMKIYEMVNDLYTKYMKLYNQKSDGFKSATAKYSDKYYQNLEKDNKIYKLEKEIEELKKIINNNGV